MITQSTSSAVVFFTGGHLLKITYYWDRGINRKKNYLGTILKTFI